MRNIAVLLAFSLALAACSGERATSNAYTGSPVVLISIDTLRSDRLPVYGSKRIAAPAFDAFAADAITFDHAYSHVPLTLPSHLTMFTGMLPQDFNVRDNVGFTFDDSRHPTLASILKRNGYATGAAVSAYVLRGSTGAASGFDSYDDAIAVVPGAATASLQRPGSETIAIAEKWIAEHSSGKFFYFLHLYEPHTPYDAPEPFRSRYRDPYDAEVAYADSLLGGFLDFLKKSGVYDRALVVVLSDHGEGLMDHGEQEHGILLYREDVQVPLMLKLPHSADRGRRVEAPVQLSDVFPTIVKISGASVPKGIRGRSLLDAAAKGNEERTVFSETLYPRIHLGWSELRSLSGERYHFIDAPHPELYDMKSDPAEKRNVLADERRMYTQYRVQLETYGKEIALPSKVDPEEAKKLAALGYLSAAQPSAAANLPDPKERIGDLEKVRQAYALTSKRQYREAIAVLQNVLRSNPGWTDAWSELGTCYESMGDYETAAGTYGHAITISPTVAPEFALKLASMLLKLGRFDDAAAHAQLAIAENPGGAHQILSEVALARNQLDVAGREAQSTANVPEYRLQGELLVAQVASAAGRLDDCLRILAQLERDAAAMHRLPFAFLELVRGDALARLNRTEEAKRAFRREIEAFPQDRQAYANLAILELVGGARAEAYATIESMVRANPDRHTALFAARALETVGDGRAAAQWRRRAESLQ